MSDIRHIPITSLAFFVHLKGVFRITDNKRKHVFILVYKKTSTNRDGKSSYTKSHCHSVTVTVSLTPCRYHRVIVTVSLSLCHCHCVTVTVSLSLCYCHCVTITVSLSLCHCHCVTVTVLLSLCHCHCVTVTVSLRSGSDTCNIWTSVHYSAVHFSATPVQAVHAVQFSTGHTILVPCILYSALNSWQ